MSLDVYFGMPACPHCGAEAHDVAQFNYTYNCKAMWREAGWDDRAVEGKPASEMVEMLKKTIQNLERNKQKFDAMNPPNGWGDRRGLVRHFLGPMYAAARKHPKATIRMWR